MNTFTFVKFNVIVHVTKEERRQARFHIDTFKIMSLINCLSFHPISFFIKCNTITSVWHCHFTHNRPKNYNKKYFCLIPYNSPKFHWVKFSLGCD